MACALIDKTGLDPDDPALYFSGMVVFIVIMLLGIAGLFRLGELLANQPSKCDPAKLLRRKQIRLLQDPTTQLRYVRVYLFKSKGDPHGEGVPVYVASHPTRRYCPVVWTERYLQLTASKNVTDLSAAFQWPTGGVVTKSSFIRKLKQRLESSGFDPSGYAGHSLRIGGAVSLKRAGVAEHIIQKLGRWKSDAYKLYIHWIPASLVELRDLLRTKQCVRRRR